jgi:hypothetical protein
MRRRRATAVHSDGNARRECVPGRRQTGIRRQARRWRAAPFISLPASRLGGRRPLFHHRRPPGPCGRASPTCEERAFDLRRPSANCRAHRSCAEGRYYLSKPIRAQDLDRALAEALPNGTPSRPLAASTHTPIPPPEIPAPSATLQPLLPRHRRDEPALVHSCRGTPIAPL